MNKYYIIIGLAILMPILYVVSAFVVAIICVRILGIKTAPDWFDTVYYPLHWASENSQIIKDVLNYGANAIGIR